MYTTITDVFKKLWKLQVTDGNWEIDWSETQALFFQKFGEGQLHMQPIEIQQSFKSSSYQLKRPGTVHIHSNFKEIRDSLALQDES